MRKREKEWTMSREMSESRKEKRKKGNEEREIEFVVEES